MWRYIPWTAALALAPIMYGAVDPGGQILVGLLLGLGWLLLAKDICSRNSPIIPLPFTCLILILGVVYMLPLPSEVIKTVSFERFQIAQRFAIDPQQRGVLFLTSSFTGSIQRYWEIALIIATFQIARLAIKNPGVPAMLVGTLVVTLCILTGAEVWRRASGQPIWQTAPANAAGTFANRDHFANWVCVCLLFLLAWVLRCFWPLQSFRAIRIQRQLWVGFSVSTILVCGLIAVVSSTSRGAFLCLVAGIVAWGFLLTTQTRNQKRLAALVLVGIAGVAILLISGDVLLKRLADTGSTLTVKFSLWRDGLHLFPKYWLFGTGLGTFERVYPIAKSLFPGIVVLHTENEFVEQLVETGVVGCAILLVCFFFFARHFMGWFLSRDPKLISPPGAVAMKKARRECAEPELLMGAMAALFGFLVHAFFEFVFHIPANAILAASLFGIIVGLADGPQKSLAPPPPSPWRLPLHLICAASLLIIAGVQGLAFFHWQKAVSSGASPMTRLRENSSAVHLWPFDSHRLIVLARAEVLANQKQSSEIQSEEAAGMDRALIRAIKLDELNWELRLEKCILNVQFSTNRAECYREAVQIIQLNPLQPGLPLQLARTFARRYPSEGLAILRDAKFSEPERIGEALGIAWGIEPETEVLWSVTPNTPAGLVALGSFADKHNLRPLAIQAFMAAKGRINNFTLAEIFLNLDRPDLALSLIPSPPSTAREKLIAAHAYFKTGNFIQSIQYSESIIRDIDDIANVPAPARGHPVIPDKNPTNQADAEHLAASLDSLDSAPDIQRIRELRRLFPKSKSIGWSLLQSERQGRQYEAAARTGLELAEDVVNAR